MDQTPRDSVHLRNSIARLRPGVLVEGKYRLDRVVGRGGMGLVFAATHVALGERVALKFLRAFDRDTYGDFYARFAREARVCAKLKNEHIARVHDVGAWEGTTPYMVMDYVAGVDLQGELKRIGRMPLVRAVDFAFQICEALVEAHALGIIHRDLKPANLVITTRSDGSELLKVLDFGISKISGDDEFGEVTQAGSMLGSPKYMAPEQLLGREIDARADVWSIGAILYTMLTGRPAYDCPSLHALLLAIASGAPLVPPSRLASTIPPALDALILRCLSHDRERRFSSVTELADSLMVAVGATVPAGARVQIAALVEHRGPPSEDSTIPSSSTSTDKHLALAVESSIPPLSDGDGEEDAERRSRPAFRRSWIAAAGVALTLALGIAQQGGVHASIFTSAVLRPTRTKVVALKTLASEPWTSLAVADVAAVAEPPREPSLARWVPAPPATPSVASDSLMAAIAVSLRRAEAAAERGRP